MKNRLPINTTLGEMEILTEGNHLSDLDVHSTQYPYVGGKKTNVYVTGVLNVVRLLTINCGKKCYTGEFDIYFYNQSLNVGKITIIIKCNIDDSGNVTLLKCNLDNNTGYNNWDFELFHVQENGVNKLELYTMFSQSYQWAYIVPKFNSGMCRIDYPKESDLFLDAFPSIGGNFKLKVQSTPLQKKSYINVYNASDSTGINKGQIFIKEQSKKYDKIFVQAKSYYENVTNIELMTNENVRCPIQETGELPSSDLDTLYGQIRVKKIDGGVDEVYICVTNDSGEYYWHKISLG